MYDDDVLKSLHRKYAVSSEYIVAYLRGFVHEMMLFLNFMRNGIPIISWKRVFHCWRPESQDSTEASFFFPKLKKRTPQETIEEEGRASQ